MGLLSLGTPLTYSETEKHVNTVHSRAIVQLKNAFKVNYNRSNEPFYWGDELEYSLVNFDKTKQNATLDLEHDYILSNFEDHTEKFKEKCVPNDILYHPEYGRFMIEATPLKPYNGNLISDYLYVEKNMNSRRKVMIEEIKSVDKNDHIVLPLSITAFPRMGAKNFTTKEYPINGPASHSLFLPDEIINRHVRFPTLTKNIRTRRGSKVAINVPIYPDVNTQSLKDIDHNIPKRNVFFEDDEPFLGAALPGHIYMDSMGFGMGCSCLQVTMQAANIDESRYLYDTLLPLTPIMLSLSAAAPIFKGTLSNQDVRWNIISMAVDDRTPIERNVKPMKNHKDIGGVDDSRRNLLQKISKSRYDSISSYLGDYNSKTKTFSTFNEKYNDLDLEINESVYNSLKSNDLFDELLALHFGHLFIRYPLVVFDEKLKSSTEEDDDHFQNIQSTNWQTLRFKPPTNAKPHPNSPGWRVEFRPLEIQVTDFENAAYSVFIILLSKAILKYKPNYYIPVSKIDENMEKAHHRNSYLDEKFEFKLNNDTKQYSIDDIINGEMIPMVKKYIDEEFSNISSNEKLELYNYLQLISLRANGEITTMATFIRSFVFKHPDYKKDSIINEKINYDLLWKLKEISEYKNKNDLTELFGEKLGEFIFRTRS